METDRTGGAIAQNSVQFQVSIDGRTYDVLVYDYSDSYTFTLFGDEVIGDTLASGIINDNGTWTNSSFSSGTNTGEEWIGNDEVNARADEITALINKAYLTLGS